MSKLQEKVHEAQVTLETLHNNVATEVALTKSRELLEVTTAQLQQREGGF